MLYLLAQITGFLAIASGLAISGKEDQMIAIGITLGYAVIIIMATYHGILLLLLALLISIMIVTTIVWITKKIRSRLRKQHA